MTTQTTTDWKLDKEFINEFQQQSIVKMSRMGKGAHTIDVIIRYEGQDHRFQADWIKYLREIP